MSIGLRDGLTMGEIRVGSAITSTLSGANLLVGTAINSAEIADDSILSGHILANNVISSKIPTDAILSGHILAANVIAGKLGTDSVLSGNILAGNVISTKIADNAVLSGHILASNVISSKIADNAVLSGHILAGNVTFAKLADNAVSGTAIATGGVGTIAKIFAGVIDADTGTLSSGSRWVAFRQAFANPPFVTVGFDSNGRTANQTRDGDWVAVAAGSGGIGSFLALGSPGGYTFQWIAVGSR